MRHALTLPALCLLIGAFGCAEDLEPDDKGADAGAQDTEIEDRGDGTFALTVDASDEEAWVYLHFQEGLVGAADPWDLAIRRFAIDLPDGAYASHAPDATLDPAGKAPDAGWMADVSADELALGGWYDYDMTTHVLSPKPGIWYVSSADASRYHALRIDGYYDAAGTAGHLALVWAEVEAPANPPMVEVPDPRPAVVTLAASRDDDWTAFDLVAGREARPGEPWDLAVYGVRVRTNGGTSGEGMGAAQAVDAPVFDAITTPDPAAWVVDAMIPEPGPPGSGEFSGNPVLSDWYDYNPASHMVSPKARVFAVRLAGGGLARVRVAGYAEGRMTIESQYAGDGETSF